MFLGGADHHFDHLTAACSRGIESLPNVKPRYITAFQQFWRGTKAWQLCFATKYCVYTLRRSQPEVATPTFSFLSSIITFLLQIFCSKLDRDCAQCSLETVSGCVCLPFDNLASQKRKSHPLELAAILWLIKAKRGELVSSGGLVGAHRLVGGANLYPQPCQLRQAQESSTVHNIPANETDFQMSSQHQAPLRR